MEFGDELFNRLLILRMPGVGPVKYNELIIAHGSAGSAVEFLNPTPAHLDSVRREIDLAQKLNIRFVCMDDAQYPDALREIKNAPPVISVRGNVAALSRPMTAIVGTRHASAAGMKFVFNLARVIASNSAEVPACAGMTDAIVSGMAMGTDTAAHMGALDTGGVTVAVLAGGVDNVWPPENENLYYRIIESGGAAISEMPVGTAPDRNMFAIRNKWIAGMSGRLILGEADLKSGSMITAQHMIKFGRPVFAIPGAPYDPRAAAPNRLISTGNAKMVTGFDDFGIVTKSEIKKPIPESQILDALSAVPTPESVLANIAKKSVAEIRSELTILELSGYARKIDGGWINS